MYLSRNKVAKVMVMMPKEVGLYLLNQQKKHLIRIEQEFTSEILVVMSDALKVGQIQIEPVVSL